MNFDCSQDVDSGFEDARAFRLCSDVAVVIWDLPEGTPPGTKFTLAAPRQLVPLVSFTILRANGDRRILWALRTGERAEPLTISADGRQVSPPLILDTIKELPPLDAESLVEDIAPQDQLKFLSNLLTVWRSAFRLSNDQIFASIVRDVIFTLTPQPRPTHIICRLTRPQHLLETAVDSALGEISAIYAVDGSTISPQPSKYVVNSGSNTGWRQCHILLETARPISTPLMLVIVGKKGMALRELADATPQHPDFQQWWAKQQGNAELREFALRQLAQNPGTGLATALDLQLRNPLPVRRIGKSATHPAAEVDLALALKGGVLAGGWTHDPASTLAGIDFLKEDGSAVPLDTNWYQFPGWARLDEDGPKTDVTGFVAWLPLDEPAGPLLQPRFRMRLASDTAKPLIPKPQPFEPAAQRARILRALPPQHATDGVFQNILAPALRDMEDRLGKSVDVSWTKDYGLPQKAPLVSIVVPLYRVLDFLRFQQSAMATDPWLVANAEIVYVLDSPEIQDETEHMLGGLHLLHGLPMKFVVMNRNGGYARACNAGARHARGSILVMLNSDVVPAAQGWLQPLCQALTEQKRLGAIGPKLIFEDGSLQHAGLYFARDQRGTWLNHHFYKGMPGDYAPAQQAREVPGVTGACLVTRKDIYDLVGGFTEDYIIGDYEDSDLCLKIRQIGFHIAYEPSSCLYHFERRSIRRSDDYMRGVASQHNAWLHTRRWNTDIAELMAELSDEEPGEIIIPLKTGKKARSAA